MNMSKQDARLSEAPESQSEGDPPYILHAWDLRTGFYWSGASWDDCARARAAFGSSARETICRQQV